MIDNAQDFRIDGQRGRESPLSATPTVIKTITQYTCSLNNNKTYYTGGPNSKPLSNYQNIVLSRIKA